MTVKTMKIHDTGKGLKSVKDDLEAVLRKIEGWHQGSIAGFLISYRDRDGVRHEISWDGKEAAAGAAIAAGNGGAGGVAVAAGPAVANSLQSLQ